MKDLIIVKNRYLDSLFLSRIGRVLERLPHVKSATALMGTNINCRLLEATGFGKATHLDVSPLDLLVGVEVSGRAGLDITRRKLEQFLEGEGDNTDESAVPWEGDGEPGNSLSLSEVLRRSPDANLVSIAVPGSYAAYVANRALDRNRHVFLFSDNVSVEDELTLKKRAAEKNLLFMGPDCGTAMISGTCLGFCNMIDPGTVGVVSTSGTAIQKFTSHLSLQGRGISHAIGTGSRDMTSAIGGVMTEVGMRLLAEDSRTDSLVAILRCTDRELARRMHQLSSAMGKKAVFRYLGFPTGKSWALGDAIYAATLEEAALLAAGKLVASPWTGSFSSLWDEITSPDASLTKQLPEGKMLLGLFAGSSSALEAEAEFLRQGYNITMSRFPIIPGSEAQSKRSLLIDLGNDYYTLNRPHPLLDHGVRLEFMNTLGSDKEVEVLLMDMILGHGTHPDPAPELVESIEAQRSRRPDRPLEVVVGIVGTVGDPQGLERQQKILERAGISTVNSVPEAVRLAIATMEGRAGQSP